MANLTAQQKRAIWAERDKSIKESEKQDNINKQLKIRQENRAIQAARDADEARENTKEYPYNPKSRTYWQIVEEKANDLQNKSFSGYNDWAIGMMEIFHALTYLNKAIYYDPPDLIPYSAEIKGIVGQVKDQVKDKAWEYTFGWGKKALMNNKDLPALHLTADVNEHGHFSAEITKDIDGPQKLSTNQQASFNAAIKLWAKTQGYDASIEPDPADPTGQNVVCIYRDMNNPANIMDHDTFKRLSEDPNTGLGAFLSGRFELNVDYTPPVSSGP